MKQCSAWSRLDTGHVASPVAYGLSGTTFKMTVDGFLTTIAVRILLKYFRESRKRRINKRGSGPDPGESDIGPASEACLLISGSSSLSV